MLDNDFCEFLEFELSKAFANLTDDKLKYFWCDGVLLSEPDKYYSQKSINFDRQVSLKAFIGLDGQTEYKKTLKFGSKSSSRYARNLDIKECLPSPQEPNWLALTPKTKKLKYDLDKESQPPTSVFVQARLTQLSIISSNPVQL